MEMEQRQLIETVEAKNELVDVLGNALIAYGHNEKVPGGSPTVVAYLRFIEGVYEGAAYKYFRIQMVGVQLKRPLGVLQKQLVTDDGISTSARERIINIDVIALNDSGRGHRLQMGTLFYAQPTDGDTWLWVNNTIAPTDAREVRQLTEEIKRAEGFNQLRGKWYKMQQEREVYAREGRPYVLAGEELPLWEFVEGEILTGKSAHDILVAYFRTLPRARRG